jgi:hypothetical protein
MHPTIGYQIAKAQIAARHRRAEQAAIIHAARRAHGTATPQRPRAAAALARRLVALLAAHRRVVRAPARPLPACSPPGACPGCA